MDWKPAYVGISEKDFTERIAQLWKIFEKCELCPRKCGVNRLAGETGYCKETTRLRISNYAPHMGEEDVLLGENGSGLVFITGCHLRCSYCLNYQVSLYGKGYEISEEECARIMLTLQNQGCPNINFVSPTHFTPNLVKAIYLAAKEGLSIPVVWNCSGYESVEVIKLLEGIIDIYLPDIKYSRSDSARAFSNAEDYFERCKESIKEMYRQVGDLKIENGIARRGLLIRHLILPDGLAGSEEVLSFIAKEISIDTYVNIMSQFRPSGEYNPRLNRPITAKEFDDVMAIAEKIGLKRATGVY